MTAAVVLASVMVGAVASLLWAVRVGDRTQQAISKTASSMAFVMLGVFRWSAGDVVGGWILAGLALCAVGDVLLLQDRFFDIGLLAFLLGHIFYIIGFHMAVPVTEWPLAGLAPLVVTAIATIRWLWPHLERRKPTVVCYAIVISAMVWGGLSTSWVKVLPWTAGVGSLLFYVSDLAVSRHRFVKPEFFNRAVGLPLYFAGQFLLAFTVGS